MTHPHSPTLCVGVRIVKKGLNMAIYIFGANGLLLESGIFDSFGAFTCITLIILVAKKIFGGVSE